MPLKYSFEVINIVQFLFKMDGAAGVGRKSINLQEVFVESFVVESIYYM